MKTLLIMLCFICGTSHIQAQSISKQVLGSSGESLSNGNRTINFTVGEPIVGMIQNGATIHQGFWAELFSDETLNITILTNENTISVFPNPAVNYLNFHFKQNKNVTYSVKLFDITGKMILNTNLQSQNQNSQLDISQLSNGMYVLTLVSKDSSYNQSFKILKKDI
jgi:hypothetical protein